MREGRGALAPSLWYTNTFLWGIVTHWIMPPATRVIGGVCLRPPLKFKFTPRLEGVLFVVSIREGDRDLRWVVGCNKDTTGHLTPLSLPLASPGMLLEEWLYSTCSYDNNCSKWVSYTNRILNRILWPNTLPNPNLKLALNRSSNPYPNPMFLTRWSSVSLCLIPEIFSTRAFGWVML